MERLTTAKRLLIVKLYLSGLSHDEIAAKTGISKGTVANVVAELKAGMFPEAANVSELIETLRELSLDLRRLRLTPGQCAIGLALINRITECGLEPADIDRWPVILKSVRNDDEAQEFVRLVYSIQEVQQRTGLSLEDLDNKVHELERKAADLEPITKQHDSTRKQLAKLSRQRRELTDEVAKLEEKYQLLNPRVNDLEKREGELSRRIKDMEPRAEKTETTLISLNKEMQKLQDTGLTLKELTEFSQRVQSIAQRSNIKPVELRTRLLHELENLDKVLALEALIETRQKELDKKEQAISELKEELETGKAVVSTLKKEKTNLEASIKETTEKVIREIAKITQAARDEFNKMMKELGRGHNEVLAGVNWLKDETLDVGKEIGKYEGIVQVNRWLDELLALATGEESIEGKRVRVIMLLVLRGAAVWFQRNETDALRCSALPSALEKLIRELEQWKA